MFNLIVGNIRPLALAPDMMARCPYDPVKDLSVIGRVVSTNFLAVIPANQPANTMQEFIRAENERWIPIIKASGAKIE